jgi:DNA replication and repair protein RecF
MATARDRRAGLGADAALRLVLTDFRSYARLRLEVGPGPVVLTGPNGAGKTNLLEALSLLAPGRGLRRARLAEIDREGGGPFAVAARIDGADGPIEIGTARDGERRILRIDGEPCRQLGKLAELLSIVWLTPEMDRLLQESASARRRFLDRLVLGADPVHARQLAVYEHAIRERARLLQAGRADPAWLAALEQRAAAAGVAVAAARQEVVAGLRTALASARGPMPRPELAVAGTVEGWLGEAAAVDVEARLADALTGSRERDRQTGGAAIGPHRSDLVVHDVEQDQPAARASTGRQKALLVAIVLAEARLKAARGGRLPLLLLDEVAAHLDPERRAQLFEAIVSEGAQAWLTGTEPGLFRPLAGHAQFLNIRNANVTEA